MKLTSLIALFCFAGLTGNANQQKFDKVERDFLKLIDLYVDSLKDTDEQNLLNAVHRYIAFINRLASGEPFPQMQEAAALILPNCKRVFNGKLISEDRESFISDLLSVQRTKDCWKIHPTDIILSKGDHKVVVPFLIEMQNFGTFTAIVIFHYDENYMIQEINEVFNSVENSYNFEGN